MRLPYHRPFPSCQFRNCRWGIRNCRLGVSLRRLPIVLLLLILQLSARFIELQRQSPSQPLYQPQIVSTATAFRSGVVGAVTTSAVSATVDHARYRYQDSNRQKNKYRISRFHLLPQPIPSILTSSSTTTATTTIMAPQTRRQAAAAAATILSTTRGGSSSTNSMNTISTNDLEPLNITAGSNATTLVSSAEKNTTTPINRWVQIRQTIFPIYSTQETIKFLYIGSIKFFIILALTLTRDTKDTLVVTQCGAESIAFLKIYGVLPVATLYIAYYSKLSNIVSSKKALFYITCIPFFVFFVMYDLLIHPNTHWLHPSIDTVRQTFQTLGLVATSAVTGSSTGGGITVLMNIISHWTSAIFYIMAEIYSSVSVGLLFWSFANDVVSIEQAKRFYPLFAQMSGLAPVLAGQYMVHYASRAPNFATSLHRLTIAITIAGIMICFSYHKSCTFVERTEGIKIDGSDVKLVGDTNENSTATQTETAATLPTKKKKKPKLSMTESAKFLAGSQYLRLIAMLVLGYGLSINFTEIIWKSLVKKLYPNPLEYQRFMGNFSSVVGICTCIVIFFGVHVIRLLGWRVGAMATPSIMAVISVPFFVCILLGIDNNPLRLQTAVLCGTILSLVSKTSKYALFDPTTQMAYIPLDEESKIKGKAAIDVLGSRIGKSGGSFIQQGLVFGFGNILNAAPVVATIYYGVLVAWISAANRLSTLFNKTQQQPSSNENENENNTVDDLDNHNENSESKKGI